VASPGSGARRVAQNYMKLCVAHKMTRNNTLNKVHVAATELPQLLSQNTKPHDVAVRHRAALKFTEKKLNCWKSRGHVPMCPTAGDASASNKLKCMIMIMMDYINVRPKADEKPA